MVTKDTSKKDTLSKETDEIVTPLRLALRSFKQDRAAIVGGIIVLLIIVICSFGYNIAPHHPLTMNYRDAFQSPSAKYLLGTDRFGRDMLSRIIVGTRVSMKVSFGGIAFATITGTILGIISGYYGKIFDQILMRFIDIIFAFPIILLALAMVTVFGPSTVNVLIIIGIIYSTRFIRVARGSTLSVKEKEYVEGAKSVGASNLLIMYRFILPNILAPIIVQATFALAHAIMIEASLSFLGLGTQPPLPSWGGMLNESRDFIEIAPWLAVYPGLAIVICVLSFNMLGDGLRDALDPRLAQR